MKLHIQYDENGHHYGHAIPNPEPAISFSTSKLSIDPVCSMKVAADPRKEIQFLGRAYHFCSARCMDTFRDSPHSYLSAGSPVPPHGFQEGTIYTCPMHPDFWQASAVNCPKCSRALEPLVPSLHEHENPELVEIRRRFWWSLPLTIAVSVVAMFGHQFVTGALPEQRWIELALGTPVVLWAGWPIFQRGAQSIIHRGPNMWTLIGTGVAAAYGYSVVATFLPGLFPAEFVSHGLIGVYYEAAAITVSLTLLGQILEHSARFQTSTSIKWLLGLAPKSLVAFGKTAAKKIYH